jgi:hypothetical protein
MIIQGTIIKNAQVQDTYLAQNGLVLYYDPSNTASYPGSGTTINSLVTPNLVGTLTNVTYTSPAFVYAGNGQISVANNSALNPGTGDYSWEMWINPPASGIGTILQKVSNGGASSNIEYSFRVNGGSLFTQIGNGGSTLGTGYITGNSYTYTANQWMQVVYTWTNSSSKYLNLYINGVYNSQTANTINSIQTVTNPLYIGSYNGGEYSQYFTGKIGVVRMYNRALSATEIANNFTYNRKTYGI